MRQREREREACAKVNSSGMRDGEEEKIKKFFSVSRKWVEMEERKEEGAASKE